MLRAPRILIVSGGITGQALARALRRRGLSAEIVERTGQEEQVGTGLFLAANGCERSGSLGFRMPTSVPTLRAG